VRPRMWFAAGGLFFAARLTLT